MASESSMNDDNQKGDQTDNSQSPGSGSLKVDRLAVLEISRRKAVKKLKQPKYPLNQKRGRKIVKMGHYLD